MKLYYAPQTRSSRPRWVCEELSIPYELIKLDLSQREHKNSDYLKIHPQGLVPALADGNHTLFESSAICLYLAEKYPEKKLLPSAGSIERAHCYQWIFFSMTNLEPLLMSIFLHTMKLPEDKRSSEVVEDSKSKAQPLIEILEKALNHKTYLVNETFSVADIIVGASLFWANYMGIIPASSSLQPYLERLRNRPAYQKATAS